MTMTVARQRLSTPRLLVLCLIGIPVLAFLVGAFALSVAGSAGQAARTIGRDAEPSVALGLRIATTLGEMNSEALGDSLADGGKAAGTSARYRGGLARLGDDLVEASRNITYGEAEAGPLRALEAAVHMYAEAVVEARGTMSGSRWLFTQRMKWAERVSSDFAVPQALALVKANHDQLEKVYGDYRATAGFQILGVAATLGLLLAALVGVQFWLMRRTRRLLNPLLLASSLCVVIGGVWVVENITAQRADIRVAKSDAYDSLNPLFQAKSKVYALKADVALWLLDPETRAQSSAALKSDLAALTTAELGPTASAATPLTRLDQALALERQGRSEEAAAATPHIGGLLGKELDNVTFGVAEREPATQSAKLLAKLAVLIENVQATEGKDDHGAALARWTSERPDGGASTIGDIIAALDRTIKVNQNEFDSHTSAALASMARTPWIVIVSLFAACVLAAAGLWPRLAEYR